MQWTAAQFEMAASPVLMDYRSHHKWFDWGGKSDKEIITDAWRLYLRANENALGMLLLGDAKIRSGNLLMNFGLASGNGLSDAREKQQIDEVFALRQRLSFNTGQRAVEALGPGSILNDKSWTPLLNDAFILGGVHGGHEFHWAEEGLGQHSLVGEQEFLQTRAKFGDAASQYQSALRRDEAYHKERLRHYLLGHSNFWAGGLVRIFARELLGLKRFGYEFVITGQALSFAPATFGTGTFREYMNALADVNYFAGDTEKINGAISEFLFNDRRALSTLSTGAGPSMPKLKKIDNKPGDWPKPPGS